MAQPAASAPTRESALSFRGVGYTYPGAARSVLEGVTLDVPEGERLGILGPNGGGKSTLVKLATGLLAGQVGEILVFGLSPAQARRQGLVGYVPQRVEAELAFPLSVAQVVSMSAARGVRPWRGLPADRRERVALAMDVVGIASIADRPIGALSGGQVQRTMIARALAGGPRLLLLDEPTVGIDVVGQQQFAALLGSVRERLGVTVVVVSHDLRAIAAGCDRVACLSRTLHSHTAPSGLTPKVLAEVFSHDVAAVFGDVHVDAHLAHDCDDPSHHHGPGHERKGRA